MPSSGPSHLDLFIMSAIYIVYLKIGHNSKFSDILMAYNVVRKSPR